MLKALCYSFAGNLASKLAVASSFHNKIFFAYVVLAGFYFSRAFAKKLLIAPGDGWLYNYPLKLYYAKYFINQGVHFWLPYQFLGLPFLATMQVGALYPLNFIYFFIPTPYAYNLNLILHYVLAAFFTFLYVREVTSNRFAAFLSGIVFAFSGFLIAHKAHLAMQNSAAWFPLILYLYEKMKQSLRLKYALLASMVIGVQILAGHFQICVQTYLVLILWIFFFSRSMNREERWRFIFLSCLPIFIGLLIALPQLLTTKLLSDIAYRKTLGYDFLTELSFSPFVLPILVFPFLFGGGYGTANWGEVYPVEMAAFTGIFPLVVGVWSYFKFRGNSRTIRFWGFIALLSFILVLGKNTPLYHLVQYIPVMNLFRIPARHWFEFNFAVAVLFGFGVVKLLNEEGKKNSGIFFGLVGLAVVGIFLLVLKKIPFHLHLDSFPYQEISLWAKTVQVGNPAYWLPMVFLFLYFVVLLSISNSWMSFRLTCLTLILLIIVEAFSFGGFLEQNWPAISMAEHPETITFMQGYRNAEDQGRYARVSHYPFVLSDIFPVFNVPRKIDLLTGYDPLLPADLAQLLDMEPQGESSQWPMLLQNNYILSLLNVRYILSLKENPLNQVLMRQNFYRKIDETPQYILFENTKSLPRLFCINHLQVAKNMDEVKNKLYSVEVDPSTTALVYPEDAAITKKAFSKGEIKPFTYETDEIRFHSRFSAEGFVVIADQFYPGWNAWVDGIKTKIFRVNGLLRGIVVPPGAHVVTLKYFPKELLIGGLISGFTVAGCLWFLFKTA